MHRILDFSQNPARLRTRYKQLVIEPEHGQTQNVPFTDIDVLLLAHPQITLSQSVLEEIAANGGVLIACNKKSLPVGMFVPLAAHHRSHQRLNWQINADVPCRKRSWMKIVKAKIKAQGHLLQKRFQSDFGLTAMAQRVKSGDTENVEAQAARRYWTHFFAALSNKPLHRNTDGEDPVNIRLNYGYAVLRAVVARAVCAAGLNPTIGLHHHNQANAYCLADDLMEPFRPVVDDAVFEQVSQTNVAAELTTEVKAALIEPLLGRFQADGELQTLFETLQHIVTSLVEVFAGERDNLFLPDSFEVFTEERPF